MTFCGWLILAAGLLLSFCFGTVLVASEPEGESSWRIPPREPAEAMQSFQVQAGFEMQLLAAEPLVNDPVAIEYDEDGRAYVAEMRDYPYTDRSSDRPFTDRTTDLALGRIRLLIDDNGDGVFDHSTIFAEDLSWPSGLAVSRGGLFVAATPDVWYLKDTNGDGRADERRRVLSGFRKFNVQALMNNLKWGLDHRLYGAGSSNGGQIVVGDNNAAPPVPFSTQDFRFDPLTENFEPLAGGGRFGNTFDDWGERFICNIRNPIRHIVVPDEWSRVVPDAPVPELVHDVAASGDTIPVYRISPPEPWRVINSQRLASAVDQPSPRSESVAAGYMTSACGLTFYRGSVYPPEFYGQAFLGEVAGNLIHRQQLFSEGTSFRSQRIDERSEFVASTDNWFRPVNFVNAPDGTLHVVDMYRETIEHPWSIPDDIKAHLDLESGRDRGRIYRLAPKGFKNQSPTPKLSQYSAAELVELLRHPDAWRRDTAHRLLFERQDRGAVSNLRQLLQPQQPSSRGGAQPDLNAIARVLALWSLDGLGALTRADVELAIHDPVPQVRRHAIRLAALRKLISVPSTMAADPDPAVRSELAWALATQTHAPSVDLLIEFCKQDTSDPWLRGAIVAAAKNTEAELLTRLMLDRSSSSDDPVDLLLMNLLATRVGRRGDAESILRVLTAVRDHRHEPTVFAVLSGCAQGQSSANPASTLTEIVPSGELRTWLDDQFRDALRQAADEQSDPTARTASIELLRHSEYETVAPVLKQLLSAAQPAPIQIAAVGALASFNEMSVADALLGSYRNLGPEAQQKAAEALSRADRVPHLLDAMESGHINFAALPISQRTALLRSTNPEWKARIVAIAEKQQATPRAKVVQEFASALPELAADDERGVTVFRRVCATCHRLENTGADLGPALETVQHRSPAELLIAILDPSREVLPEFVEYAVVLKDGTVLTGVITSESASSIQLKKAGAVEQMVSRADIDEIVSSGKSIMPESLESQLSAQEVADLIAYLRQAH